MAKGNGNSAAELKEENGDPVASWYVFGTDQLISCVSESWTQSVKSNVTYSSVMLTAVYGSCDVIPVPSPAITRYAAQFTVGVCESS